MSAVAQRGQNFTRAIVASFALLGCRADDEAPRAEGIVAEVHLHQYDEGSHAAAAFVASPVPFRPELDEQLVHFVTSAAAEEGACRLDVPSVCTPNCDGARAYCDSGRCVAYTPLRFEDRGPVTITGSTVSPAVTLTFDARLPGYRSDRPPTAPLFAAGDALSIVAPGLTVSVVAPAMPKLTSPIELPRDDAFPLRWERGDGEILVRVIVTTRDGASSTITCVTADEGELLVPRALVGRLPPPPRAVQVELTRLRREHRVLSRAGDRAVITVAAALVRATEQ